MTLAKTKQLKIYKSRWRALVTLLVIIIPAEIALPIFDVLQSFPTFAALPLATFLLVRKKNDYYYGES